MCQFGCCKLHEKGNRFAGNPFKEFLNNLLPLLGPIKRSTKLPPMLAKIKLILIFILTPHLRSRVMIKNNITIKVP